jgi:hypothetical protein
VAVGLPPARANTYFELLSLVLTFRPSDGGLGGRMTPAERRRVRARFEAGGDLAVSGDEFAEFFRHLPFDLLLTLRNTAIVRGLNRALGGSSRDRFVAYGESVLRGLEVPAAALDWTPAPSDADRVDAAAASTSGAASAARTDAAAGATLDTAGYQLLSAADVHALSPWGADAARPALPPPVQSTAAALNFATDLEMAALARLGRTPALGAEVTVLSGVARPTAHADEWDALAARVRGLRLGSGALGVPVTAQRGVVVAATAATGEAALAAAAALATLPAAVRAAAAATEGPSWWTRFTLRLRLWLVDSLLGWLGGWARVEAAERRADAGGALAGGAGGDGTPTDAAPARAGTDEPDEDEEDWDPERDEKDWG